jgi:hypothetical protein
LDTDGNGHLTAAELRLFLNSPELGLFSETGADLGLEASYDCNSLLNMLTEEIDFNRWVTEYDVNESKDGTRFNQSHIERSNL